MAHRKVWNRHFVHLLAIEIAFQFASNLVNPVVSNYTVALGASIAVAGFIAGLNSTMAIVARPFTGWIADRFGKKHILIAAAALFTISAVGCTISTSPAMIGFFRSIQGFAFALRTVVIMALVSLSVPADHLGRGIGWIGIASTASCALGPMAGSFIGSTFGYLFCFVVSSCLFFAGFVLAISFDSPETKESTTKHDDERCLMSGRADDRPQPPGRTRSIRISDFFYLPSVRYSLMTSCVSFPYGVTVTLLFLSGEEKGIEGISVYFALYAVAAFVMKPLAGKLSDRYGYAAVVVPSLLLEMSSCIVLAFMNSAIMAVFAGLLMGIGQASAYSTLQAQAVRGVPKEVLGRASNTFYIGPDVGMGFGPLVGGAIMGAFGSMWMYLFCALVVFIDMCCIVVVNKGRLVKRA